MRLFEDLTVSGTGRCIASLDADCTVEKNYFTELFSDLYRNKHNKACSIYFEHPLSGNDFSPDIYSNILQYELHVRYYYKVLSTQVSHTLFTR